MRGNIKLISGKLICDTRHHPHTPHTFVSHITVYYLLCLIILDVFVTTMIQFSPLKKYDFMLAKKKTRESQNCC